MKEIPKFKKMNYLSKKSNFIKFEGLVPLDIPLFVKSDGRTGSLYGGNKIRCLEYLLADIIRSEAEKVVVFSHTNSAFARAFHLYSSMENINHKFYLAHLYGEKNCDFLQNKNSTCVGYRRISKISLGMLGELSTSLTLHKLLLAKKINTYLVAPGGSNTIGSVGYLYAANEIFQEISSFNINPPYTIYLPVGTGCTISGLALGFEIMGIDANIVGINAHKKNSGRMVNRNIFRLARLLRCGHAAVGAINRVTLLSNFIGNGYGFPHGESQRMAKLFTETTGKELDDTYTAKSFWGMSDHISKFKNGNAVIFWMTNCDFKYYS